jgi:predicted RNase H-like HicB family nuclease
MVSKPTNSYNATASSVAAVDAGSEVGQASLDLPAAVECIMRNEFTAIVERDGPWYVAYCAEVPGANGQGKSRDECLANLREAIALILEHRRDESLRSLPPDAMQELVVVG